MAQQRDNNDDSTRPFKRLRTEVTPPSQTGRTQSLLSAVLSYSSSRRHHYYEYHHVGHVKEFTTTSESQFEFSYAENSRLSNSSSSSTCCILDILPDEVLGSCFFSGYLDTITVISKVSIVNKRLAQVAKKTVKLLDLRALPQLTPHDVASIVSRFRNVSVFDVSYCGQFDGRHLQELIPLSHTLQTLRLRGTAVCDQDVTTYLYAVKDFLQGQPSRLQELDMSAVKREGNQRIGDDAVAHITTCCPDLLSLQLGWCRRVSDVSLNHLQNLNGLRELDLSLSSITDQGCLKLSKLKSLKKLDLSATDIGDAAIRNLLGTTDTNHALIRSDSPPLETLRICFNDAITTESLSTLAAHVPGLKVLNITHCGVDAMAGKGAFRQLIRNGATIIGGKS